MRMMKFTTLALAAATLAACGAGYNRAKEPGNRGFYEQAEGVREYRITYRPTTAMMPDSAETRVLRRAAEIGGVRGYDWMVAEEWETRVWWLTARGMRTALWRGADATDEHGTVKTEEAEIELDPNDPNAEALRKYLASAQAREAAAAVASEEEADDTPQTQQELRAALRDGRFLRRAPVTDLLVRYGLNKEERPDGAFDIAEVLRETANP